MGVEQVEEVEDEERALEKWLLQGQAADLHPGMVCISPVAFVVDHRISPSLDLLPGVEAGPGYLYTRLEYHLYHWRDSSS